MRAVPRLVAVRLKGEVVFRRGYVMGTTEVAPCGMHRAHCESSWKWVWTAHTAGTEAPRIYVQ